MCVCVCVCVCEMAVNCFLCTSVWRRNWSVWLCLCVLQRGPPLSSNVVPHPQQNQLFNHQSRIFTRNRFTGPTFPARTDALRNKETSPKVRLTPPCCSPLLSDFPGCTPVWGMIIQGFGITLSVMGGRKRPDAAWHDLISSSYVHGHNIFDQIPCYWYDAGMKIGLNSNTLL